MNYKKSAFFILVAVLLIATVAIAAAKLPKITFVTPTSKYRAIDKDGSIVGENHFKYAIPGVGIGNIIFSPNPLPFKKEAEYKDVGTEFTWDQIKSGFYCRNYYPGKLGDIVAYVEAKYPGYKLVKMYDDVYWYPPDKGNEQNLVNYSDFDTMLSRDQGMAYFISPDGSFFEKFNLATLPNRGSGVNKILAFFQLRFNTGKKEWVTQTVGDKIVTEEQDIFQDFIVSFGECKITNP